MAKSARASSKKSNNSKLKSRVFGPVETARMERLSAKLMELASQPRPSQKEADTITMDIETDSVEPVAPALSKGSKETSNMDVDQDDTQGTATAKSGRGRIEKRKSRSSKASIVFPKYKNGKRIAQSKAKK